MRNVFDRRILYGQRRTSEARADKRSWNQCLYNLVSVHRQRLDRLTIGVSARLMRVVFRDKVPECLPRENRLCLKRPLPVIGRLQSVKSDHDENVKISDTDVCDREERETMSHLMTGGDAPNCTWTDLAIQPLPETTLPNTGRRRFDSTLVIEDSTKKSQGFVHITS